MYHQRKQWTWTREDSHGWPTAVLWGHKHTSWACWVCLIMDIGPHHSFLRKREDLSRLLPSSAFFCLFDFINFQDQSSTHAAKKRERGSRRIGTLKCHRHTHNPSNPLKPIGQHYGRVCVCKRERERWSLLCEGLLTLCKILLAFAPQTEWEKERKKMSHVNDGRRRILFFSSSSFDIQKKRKWREVEEEDVVLMGGWNKIKLTLKKTEDDGEGI